MGVGTRIRHRLGRWEEPAARLYRGLFVDLAALADLIGYATGRGVRRILEVGCGEGAFAAELTSGYPASRYLGIDVVATAGRRYQGDPGRAEFRVVGVADLLAEAPQPFDLVCLVDVLHHVPAPQRAEVLGGAAALTAPGGHLVVKDHDRDGSIGYALAYAADRFVTGDRQVSFLTRAQLHDLVGSLPGFGPMWSCGVPPLRTNVLCGRQRGGGPHGLGLA